MYCIQIISVHLVLIAHSYHHVLKSLFLSGKRNRRLDVLYTALVYEAILYYRKREKRQACGLEGDDQEITIRKTAHQAGAMIPACNIKVATRGQHYLVVSQSSCSTSYAVDFLPNSATLCSCSAWHSIEYCKHIPAVHHHHSANVAIELASATLSTSALHTRNPTLTELKPVKTAEQSAHNAAAESLAAAHNNICALTTMLSARVSTTNAAMARTIHAMLQELAILVGAAPPGAIDRSLAPNQSSAGAWHQTYHQPPPKRKCGTKREAAKHETHELVAAHGMPSVKNTHIKADGDLYGAGTSSRTLAKPDAKRARMTKTEPVLVRYVAAHICTVRVLIVPLLALCLC